MTELRKLYITDATTGATAVLDPITNSLPTIVWEHYEIHEGDSYGASIVTTSGTAVNIAFKTPAGTKKAHMAVEFTTESKAHVTATEGAAWTTNTGTVVAPKNFNRSSANTSMLLEDKTATPAYTAGGVLTNVTGISGGKVIGNRYVFASKQTGAETGQRQEWVLAADQTYTFVLTSDDGSKGLQLRLRWYEHTDSN